MLGWCGGTLWLLEAFHSLPLDLRERRSWPRELRLVVEGRSGHILHGHRRRRAVTVAWTLKSTSLGWPSSCHRTCASLLERLQRTAGLLSSAPSSVFVQIVTLELSDGLLEVEYNVLQQVLGLSELRLLRGGQSEPLLRASSSAAAMALQLRSLTRISESSWPLFGQLHPVPRPRLQPLILLGILLRLRPRTRPTS